MVISYKYIIHNRQGDKIISVLQACGVLNVEIYERGEEIGARNIEPNTNN